MSTAFKRMPFFYLIFLAVCALLHLYSYRRFVKRCAICHAYKKYFRLFLLINFLGVLIFITGRVYHLPMLLFYISSFSLGVMFAFFVLTLLHEFIDLLIRLTPNRPERRAFFKRSGEYGVMTLAGGYIAAGVVSNLAPPRIQTVRLDQGLFAKPLRVAQLSDLHIMALKDLNFVTDIVARTNALHPDIIAITGDLIDATVTQISEHLAEIAKLKATYGVYFVTGNHEFYSDLFGLKAYLASAGIRVMDNRSAYIKEVHLNIVGLPDQTAARIEGIDDADIVKATAGINPSAPTLLLAHQPRTINDLGSFKPRLMLSGHTHGGQIFPFNYLVRLQQPFISGLHQFDKESFIYVNSGTGYWGPPMRLGTHAEITLIEWS